jgi:hypothetical protein
MLVETCIEGPSENLAKKSKNKERTWATTFFAAGKLVTRRKEIIQ